jgi:hypothetical protein
MSKHLRHKHLRQYLEEVRALMERQQEPEAAKPFVLTDEQVAAVDEQMEAA